MRLRAQRIKWHLSEQRATGEVVNDILRRSRKLYQVAYSRRSRIGRITSPGTRLDLPTASDNRPFSLVLIRLVGVPTTGTAFPRYVAKIKAPFPGPFIVEAATFQSG